MFPRSETLQCPVLNLLKALWLMMETLIIINLSTLMSSQLELALTKISVLLVVMRNQMITKEVMELLYLELYRSTQ